MSDIDTRRISQTPVVTAGAYSANDAVGGLLTFVDATGQMNPSQAGLIESVVIIDRASQNAVTDLVLFSETFTATADNAAFDPTDADLSNCIGFVTVSGYASFNDNSVGVAKNVGLPLPAAGNGAIYGQLVTRGTPTYVATDDISVIITVVRG